MTVKPPTGMQEELARPVIEVVEFPSGKITHEMFAFGSKLLPSRRWPTCRHSFSNESTGTFDNLLILSSNGSAFSARHSKGNRV